MTTTSDLEFAHLLADRADSISMQLFDKPDTRFELKSDGTPVSTADVHIEETLRDLVRKHRPTEGFLGEEDGHSGPRQHRWVVDAIDGTSDFLAGGTAWGSLIALEKNGAVRVGVASSPMLGTRWWAKTGNGAWKESLPRSSATPERLTVSSQPFLVSSQITVWPPQNRLPSKWKGSALDLLNALPAPLHSAERIHCDRASRPTSKSAPGFTAGALQVASGVLDASVFFGGGPWDIAARAVICEEAGGHFTDLWGGSRRDTQTAIVSNRLVHNQILEALRPNRPQPPEPTD
ncbi:MAG: inositol monophosphatase [Acidimicrobiia bacterium]|nr:inositol monophosphatase [Acidimicrobiia bacterium]